MLTLDRLGHGRSGTKNAHGTVEVAEDRGHHDEHGALTLIGHSVWATKKCQVALCNLPPGVRHCIVNDVWVCRHGAPPPPVDAVDIHQLETAFEQEGDDVPNQRLARSLRKK
jgi:hypothetical protein